MINVTYVCIYALFSLQQMILGYFCFLNSMVIHFLSFPNNLICIIGLIFVLTIIRFILKDILFYLTHIKKVSDTNLKIKK